tara:strand:+ start:827 stop:937 length:111 start_codon:yes stop_codon:yes gene_type:complete
MKYRDDKYDIGTTGMAIKYTRHIDYEIMIERLTMKQ